MVSLLCALALMPVTYKIPAQPVNYDLDIKFDGFIPIFGGTDGTAELKVGLAVKGLAPEEGDSNPRASTDVTDLKVLLQDQMMPFTKDSVQKWFPNTVTLTPLGKVLKTDAPNIEVPVQLPGLDIKRFPEVSFLAIEFPAEGIEQGKAWTYSRQFGESTVAYTVTPTSIADGRVEMILKLTQNYEGHEDEAHSLVKDIKDAVADVKTHVEGSGTVVFDSAAGLIRALHMEANAASASTDLKTKAVTTHNLKTTEDVVLRG